MSLKYKKCTWSENHSCFVFLFTKIYNNYDYFNSGLYCIQWNWKYFYRSVSNCKWSTFSKSTKMTCLMVSLVRRIHNMFYCVLLNGKPQQHNNRYSNISLAEKSVLGLYCKCNYGYRHFTLLHLPFTSLSKTYCETNILGVY